MTNREEIAERLRVYATDFDFGDSNPIWYVEKAVFNDIRIRESGRVFSRLADLIDPTCRIYYTDTTTSTPDGGYDPDGYYSCSRCGELDDRFAEMWDDYQARNYEGEPPFRYCPYCGARVVRDDG